jgi:uncharacterized protein YqgC (DUF456 family)
MDVLLWTLAVVLTAVGFAGIVLPALPGTVLIFDDFTRVGALTLIVLGVLAAASYLVDLGAAAVGTKRLGASGRAMTGAALGTLAGLFFGLPGIIIGPFVGAMVGELTAHGDVWRAGRAGVAAWIGFAVGMAVKVGIAFLMVGIFVAAMFLF